MLGCDVGLLGTGPDPRRGAVASGRKKPRQHVADVILAAEKDRQDADPLFRFVHFEPVDRPELLPNAWTVSGII